MTTDRGTDSRRTSRGILTAMVAPHGHVDGAGFMWRSSASLWPPSSHSSCSVSYRNQRRTWRRCARCSIAWARLKRSKVGQEGRVPEIVYRHRRTAPARSGAEAHAGNRREMLTRIRLMAAATLVAAGVWLIASWLATQVVSSRGFAGVANFARCGSRCIRLRAAIAPFPAGCIGHAGASS